MRCEGAIKCGHFSVGKQQCLNGRDEDHCEQLFYSTCHEPLQEYRCQTGLCIDSEFVLDGEIDCNDLSGKGGHARTNCRVIRLERWDTV